jgi:hypothetical protein
VEIFASDSSLLNVLYTVLEFAPPKKNRIIIISNHKNIPAPLPFFVNIFFSKTESRKKIVGFLQSNLHQSVYGTIIIKKK